jgi:hypothetical protein
VVLAEVGAVPVELGQRRQGLALVAASWKAATPANLRSNRWMMPMPAALASMMRAAAPAHCGIAWVISNCRSISV